MAQELFSGRHVIHAVHARLTACGLLASLVLVSGPAWAIPFSIRVQATLDLRPGFQDTAALQGALLTIDYSADTADTADEVGVVDGRAFSRFDDFLMEVQITNRPQGAPAILGLVATNDPLLGNTFPPSLDHDDFVFDSRVFDQVFPNGSLEVDTFGIDFGTQSMFPDMHPVTSLTFFESLVGTQLDSLPSGSLTVFSGPMSVYDLINRQITVVPEPKILACLLAPATLFARRLQKGVSLRLVAVNDSERRCYVGGAPLDQSR